MAHWPLPGHKNPDECTKFSSNFNETKLCCHSLCLWELVRTHQCSCKQGKWSLPEAPGVMEPLERWDLPLVPWAGLSWRFLALTPSSRRIQVILFHEQFPLKLLLWEGGKKKIYIYFLEQEGCSLKCHKKEWKRCLGLELTPHRALQITEWNLGQKKAFYILTLKAAWTQVVLIDKEIK